MWYDLDLKQQLSATPEHTAFDTTFAALQALVAEGMPLAEARSRVEALRRQCFAVIGDN